MHRLSLQLNDKAYEALKSVTEKSNSPSQVRAVIKGLALLDLYCDIEKQGGKLMVKNKDGTEERLRIL